MFYFILSNKTLTYSVSVPSYDFGYKPITDWKYEGSGGPPTPWTTQYKQNLFSNNTLSFKGVGYQFPPITKGVVISLPHVYLLRGIKILGESCSRHLNMTEQNKTQ